MFVTSVVLNAKATEIEIKIFDICNLATKTALNTKAPEIKNKTSGTSTLFRKADYNTKIIDIENKIPDVSDLDTKLRSINSKVMSNKVRQLHTKQKLSEHITSIKN